MKTLINILYIFFFLILSCNGQQNKDLIEIPFLAKATIQKLNDKTEIEEQIGCIVEHSTVGEQELEKVLLKSKFSRDQKVQILEAIVVDSKLFHLHKLAGNRLQKNGILIERIRKYSSNNYLLFRAIFTIEDEFIERNFLEIDSNILNDFLFVIKNNEVPKDTKMYFNEATYCLTNTNIVGEKIHSEITKMNIDSDLKNYNDELYSIYTKCKPIYSHLDTIHTWMEMDRNIDNLKMLFSIKEPIMFFQILSQNSSTVLRSKELCELKNDAILNIIKNTKPKSFFYDFKIYYLAESLIENNYTIRFLETIKSQSEIKNYFANIEKQQ